MFCTHCGKEIDNNAVVCVGCGYAIDDPKKNIIEKPNQSQVSGDKSSGAWAFLSFAFPVVGFILFILWKNNMPLRAKSCGVGTIIGGVLQFLLYIFVFVAWIFIGFQISSQTVAGFVA